MTSTLTSAGCGCGCSEPNKPDVCELHSLVRPRFFCGQLLTDQDLSELITWVLDRRKLGRYRDGWGVVCGLDVGADPELSSGVIVRAGYAVSSCGDDVVLPASAKFDLAPCCPGLSVPCDTTNDQPLPENCVVDLGVVYAERGEDPVLALGRAACGEAGECENSRSIESYQLVCHQVVDGTEPDQPDWRLWQQGYADAVAPLERAKEEGLPGQAQPESLRSWLADRLRERPASHFGFLTDWLAATEPTLDAARFVQLLFWLVQDRILTFLSCGCPPGCPGKPVPLARIWLVRRQTSDGRQQWAVKAVDPVSPYRHGFGPVGWPAELGKLNLARVVWHRPEEACMVLQQLGVDVHDISEWTIPSTMDELSRMIGKPPTISCHESVALRYIAMPEGSYMHGERVVGFLGDGGNGRTASSAPTVRAAEQTSRTRASAKTKPAPKPTRRRADEKARRSESS